MRPYVPDPLPLTGLDYGRLIRLTGPASAALARYDGLLQSIVNPTVMLSPLTDREAVLSSKIEGTQATVDEVLEYEAGIEFDAEKVRDIQEILNYRRALMQARDWLATYPLNLSVLRQMHATLMDSVRGADKSPGEFRTRQNWLERATFVPPSPLQLADHLRAFEQYMAEDVDPLIQVAVVHAQFELLHPFNDGNGRIGRLLIPLHLYKKGVLASPMFYLSEYLEAHRDTYHARLRGISADGDWTGWIEFFLTAIAEQAKANADRVKLILDLYSRMKRQVGDLLRSKYSLSVLDTLFDRPIFSSTDFVTRSGIPRNTALPFLRELRKAGILKIFREQVGSQASVLAFSELLNAAEGRKVI